MKKTCIVIVGPTAVGKTRLAIEIAQSLQTQIISADSRQCYKELNIGVAKPSVEELHIIQHHFINSHSIFDEVNAGVFESYALEKVGKIFENNNYAVMVGGTGLYIKAFCEGIDPVPKVDGQLREKIIELYQQKGLQCLQEEVLKNDPMYYSVGEIKNPQRLMRALEVKLFTGKSIIEFQSSKKEKRGFNIIKVGLELPRNLLYQQIDSRVDEMIKTGLIKEAKNLAPNKNLNALQTVGYKELFDFFDEKILKDKAIEDIKLNTRHYAKRQLTWFKKDKGILWYDLSKYKYHQVGQTILAAIL